MSRHIAVHHPNDFGPSDAPGGWCVVEGSTSIYDAPLGSEASVREWWSTPADELGLPRLADIYERGFDSGVRWSGVELCEVATELGRLEAYWRAQDLPEIELTSLLERGTFLREALSAAELAGGIVVIT